MHRHIDNNDFTIMRLGIMRAKCVNSVESIATWAMSVLIVPILSDSKCFVVKGISLLAVCVNMNIHNESHGFDVGILVESVSEIYTLWRWLRVECHYDIYRPANDLMRFCWSLLHWKHFVNCFTSERSIVACYWLRLYLVAQMNHTKFTFEEIIRLLFCSSPCQTSAVGY